MVKARKKKSMKGPYKPSRRKRKTAPHARLTYDEKRRVSKFRMSTKDEPIHQKFLDVDQIKEYLTGLADKYPTRIDVKSIGNSSKGRPILMAYLTDGNISDDQKYITVVEAGSNGSDFYSVSSALYLIDYLIKRPNLNKLMDYLIIPCSNPDGYLHFLSEKESDPKVATDLSCNYPLSHLGWCDLSKIPTEQFLNKLEIWKEKYRLNCPETQVIRYFLRTYHVAIKLFISLQEGGEKIVFPYGCCDSTLLDEYDLRRVAKSGAAGFKNRCICVGSMYNCCGLTYGSLIDYFRSEQSVVKLMYIIHLNNRTTSAHSVENIREYGDRVAHCVTYMMKSAHKLSMRNTFNVD